MAYADPTIEAVNRSLAHNLQLAGDAPKQLLDAMTYSLMAGGKRLRPRLVVLACAAVGGEWSIALDAAAAVEMVHTYSLIHDDLPAMDDDDMRRGQPTCHKKFSEATAILAGDALLTLAFHVLAVRYHSNISSPCIVELAQAAGAGGMVGGQMLDLSSENQQDVDIRILERMHSSKTGALITACLRIGGIIGRKAGSSDDAAMNALTEYGRAFGLVFQITDDLLDVDGDPKSAGKKLGKDAGRGKLTYPSLMGITESRELVKRLCQKAQDSLEPLGPGAGPLRELAESICNRDR